MKKRLERQRLLKSAGWMLLVLLLLLTTGCNQEEAVEGETEVTEVEGGVEEDPEKEEADEVIEEEDPEDEDEIELTEENIKFLWGFVEDYYNNSARSEYSYQEYLEIIDGYSPLFIQALWDLKPYLTFSDYTNIDTMEEVVVKDLQEKYGEYWAIAYADLMPREEKIKMQIFILGTRHRDRIFSNRANWDINKIYFNHGNIVSPEIYLFSEETQGNTYLPGEIMAESSHREVFDRWSIRDTHADFFHFIPMLNSGVSVTVEGDSPYYHFSDPDLVSDEILSIAPAAFLTESWLLQEYFTEHGIEVYCMFDHIDFIDFFYNSDQMMSNFVFQ